MNAMSTAAIQPAAPLPRTRKAPEPRALLRGARIALSPIGRLLLSASQAFAMWRLQRQMLGVDSAMLKDVGVSRCELDWALRHGRENRPTAKP